MFFILNYPKFLIFYTIFCQNAHNTYFFTNFSQFRPNFVTFLLFFQLIITYHVIFYFRLTSFYNFLCIFYVKMHIIPIFYQFFSIFAIFDQFWPNLETSLLFIQFFSSDNNLSCVFYFILRSIRNFYVIMCVKMLIIPNFYQF